MAEKNVRNYVVSGAMNETFEYTMEERGDQTIVTIATQSGSSSPSQKPYGRLTY